MLMTNAANTGRRLPLALLLAVGACSGSTAHDAPASAGVASPSSATTSTGVQPFEGYVQSIYSTGDFVLVVGNVRYTVVMSPTTMVLNLRGRQIPRQFMTAAQSVTVTGTLVDSKIQAQSILVPTRKEES